MMACKNGSSHGAPVNAGFGATKGWFVKASLNLRTDSRSGKAVRPTSKPGLVGTEFSGFVLALKAMTSEKPIKMSLLNI